MKKIIALSLIILMQQSFAKEPTYNWVEVQTGSIQELTFKKDNKEENDAIKSMLSKNLNSHETNTCSTEKDYFKNTIKSLDGCIISKQNITNNKLFISAICEDDEQNITLTLNKKNKNSFVGSSIVTSNNDSFSLHAETKIEVKKNGDCK